MINEICKKVLGKTVKFKTAFNHSSYANKMGLESNEKLEFLGDSIINFYVTKHIFSINASEGKLSALRAKMVSTSFFAKVCDEIMLTKNLNIIGEISPKIKANLIEAVIAEIYLNLKSKDEIENIINYLIINKFSSSGLEDYKTALQEKLQKNKNYEISYTCALQENGFVASVYNKGKLLAQGVGKSKKLAEKDAAKNALINLEKRG